MVTGSNWLAISPSPSSRWFRVFLSCFFSFGGVSALKYINFKPLKSKFRRLSGNDPSSCSRTSAQSVPKTTPKKLRKFAIDCWLGQDTVSAHSSRKVSDWLLAQSRHSQCPFSSDLEVDCWLAQRHSQCPLISLFFTIRSYAVIQDPTGSHQEVSEHTEVACSCFPKCFPHYREGTVIDTPFFRFRRFFDSPSNSFSCLINFWDHGYVVIIPTREYIEDTFWTPFIPGFIYVYGLRFSVSKFLDFFFPIPTSNFEILNLVTYLVPRLPAPLPQSFSDPCGLFQPLLTPNSTQLYPTEFLSRDLTTVWYPYIRWLTDLAPDYSIVHTSSVTPYFGTSFELIWEPFSIRIAPFGLIYIPPRVFERPSQYRKCSLLLSPNVSVLRSTRRWIDWYFHWKQSKSLIV